MAKKSRHRRKSRSSRRGHRSHRARGRHRSHRSRKPRISRRMRRARKTQNRTHSRASTRGFRKLKSRGRTKIKRSTFFKLRRHARNPPMSRVLRDGTQVTLDPTGSGGIIRVFSDRGEVVSEKVYGSMSKAMARFRKYSSGKKFAARQEREDWSMLAGDNPRRRGRRSRRNPAQFPTPFTSALMMNPRRRRKNPRIRRKDAKAMSRVLRKHGYKRCRV